MKQPFKVDGVKLLASKGKSGLFIYATKDDINQLSDKYDLGYYDWQEIARDYGLPVESVKICFKIIQSNKVDHDRIELYPISAYNEPRGVCAASGRVKDFWPVEFYNKVKKSIYNLKE